MSNVVACQKPPLIEKKMLTIYYDRNQEKTSELTFYNISSFTCKLPGQFLESIYQSNSFPTDHHHIKCLQTSLHKNANHFKPNPAPPLTNLYIPINSFLY